MKKLAVLAVWVALALSTSACSKTETKPGDKMGGAPPPVDTTSPSDTPPAEEPTSR